VTLATLSNGDEGSLRRLLGHLPVPFDIVSSTEGGKFKPHAWIYERTLERVGARAAEVLHVCGSHTDAMGATAAGIMTVWVNRGDEAVIDPRFAPAYQTTDLWGVLPLLA
jgi:FMN phosphatase YigB (HAD superfamily)